MSITSSSLNITASDGESLIAIDLDGDGVADVAARVDAKRIPSTGGIEVYGCVRQINETGETVLDKDGQEVMNEFRTSFPPTTVQKHGIPYLCRQILLAMLGQPLDYGKDEFGNYTGPWKPSEDILLNISIINDIQTNAAAEAAGSAGSLLSL